MVKIQRLTQLISNLRISGQINSITVDWKLAAGSLKRVRSLVVVKIKSIKGHYLE